MRAVDLAVYADELAARAATLAAQLERTRGRLRQAAIEREARRSLDAAVVARVEALGLLRAGDTRSIRAEVLQLAADLAAVEDVQAWVERKLAAARDEIAA